MTKSYIDRVSLHNVIPTRVVCGRHESYLKEAKSLQYIHIPFIVTNIYRSVDCLLFPLVVVTRSAESLMIQAES